ncbi:MAG TPA: fibronectin type III domain-containing protein, partial [Paenibacillus sp.]|nr:fibronectin type III domain-containing protein [Paenibacillus sp.]
FGYSRALGMLEYWNESDNRVDTSAEIRADWHSEMDAYWKSLDFYNHPTSTSFAWKDHVGQNHGSWDTLPFLDATNSHRYDDSPNVIDNWEAQIEKLHDIGNDRPAFMAEIGRPTGDYSTDPTTDEYMHDSLWAPIFRAGAAGGSLWWILETGFDLPASLKAVHTRLADFVQPLEEHLIDMPHVDYGLQSNDTKVGGFKSNERAYLWINDTQSNWTVANPRTVSGMTFTLPMANGSYDVMFYDTYSGQYGTTATAQASGGNLTITVPSFTRDIAVRIECDGCYVPDTEAPTAPTNLTSPSKTSTTVGLSWTASTDNIGVAGYEVYKDGAYLATVTGATTYSASGLTPETTYSFTVRAKDAMGNVSPASQALQVTTNVDTSGMNLLQNPGFELDNGSGAPASWICEQAYCSRDTAVKRSGDASMKVDHSSGAWFGQYQIVPGIAGETYAFEGHVNVARNSGTTINVDVLFLNASNSVLASHTAKSYNGTTTSGWEYVQGAYAAPAGTAKVKVQVYYMNLNAAVYLDDFSLMHGDTEAPTSPTNLTSPSKTDTTVDLTWTASTDNVGVSSYEIYRDGAYLGAATGVTAYTATGLLPGSTYSFTVKAKDASGNVSPESQALQVTTDGDSSGINLLQNPGFELDNGSGVPASWTCEQAYCFRDTAVKRSGAASVKVDNVSNAWFGQYQIVPGIAGETYAFEGYVNVTRNTGTTVNVDVQFLNASNTVLAGHLVQSFNGTTTSGWEHVQGAYTAPAGTTKVKVQVYYMNLNAAVYLDDFSLMHGDDAEAPTAPTNLASPSKTSTTVDLTWTASTDNVGVTGYEIYKDGTFLASTTGATAYTATGLSAGTTYNFTVKAKDAAGNLSPASAALQVTTDGANLLQNPGFEDGTGVPSSWICEQSYCSRDTAVKRSGNASMKVDHVTGAWFGQYQTVDGTAGVTYAFDGYVNITRNAGTTIYVEMQFLNGSNGIISIHHAKVYNGTTTSGWEHVQVAQTAPAGTSKVKVHVFYKDLNAAVYTDDFTLTAN